MSTHASGRDEEREELALVDRPERPHASASRSVALCVARERGEHVLERAARRRAPRARRSPRATSAATHRSVAARALGVGERLRRTCARRRVDARHGARPRVDARRRPRRLRARFVGRPASPRTATSTAVGAAHRADVARRALGDELALVDEQHARRARLDLAQDVRRERRPCARARARARARAPRGSGWGRGPRSARRG